MAQQYNETEALNVPSSGTYSEYDILDFMITGDMDSDLVANSVLLTGTIEVQEPTGTRVAAKQVFFDPDCGMHAFIDNVTVSSVLGQHEHIGEYARFVKMHEMAKGENSKFNSKSVNALQSSSADTSEAYCAGDISAGTGATNHTIKDQDFAVYPKCCLNRGSGNIAFKKVQYVKLSITLNKVLSSLYTNEATPTMNYILSDVKLSYKTQPTQNQQSVMKSVVGIKQSINSSMANISAKVPAVCDSMSANFLLQSSENSATKNGQRLDRLPNVESFQCLFNDSITNNFISYALEDQGEMVQQAIESLNAGSDHNVLNSDYWKGPNYCLGINWKQQIDLSARKFNVQIRSSGGIDNSTPYLAYLYFNTQVVI